MKDRKKKDEDKTILIIWSADSHWVHHDIPGGSDGYKFLDGHAGAAGVLRRCPWHGRREYFAEIAAQIPHFAAFCGIASGFTGFLCHVLEFLQTGISRAAWSDHRRNAGGLGIWQISVQREKNLILLYMILMVMPFQVTMVSSYLVLSRLSLLDSHLAIILPGIFSTFPVFIMEKFFRSIPAALIEAAEVDGAGPFQVFWNVGVPLGIPGVMSSLILNFLEYWNAIEAPMTFLKTKAKIPLSLYLPEITVDQMGVSFAASVIMMMPAILIFCGVRSIFSRGLLHRA